VVSFTDNWRCDAARRDFTINAMSMTRAGEVYDYFGGLSDLRAGQLRFVGDPAQRVAEDYLRILRFFRFFARYGEVEPDTATLAALRGGVRELGSLAVERVWHELRLILSTPDPVASVTLMDRLGVLAAAVPEGVDVGALSRLVVRAAPADPVLRMVALLTGDPLTLAMRLKLSVADRDRLVALLTAPLARPELDEEALRRLLADTPLKVLVDRTWLAGGDGPAWGSLRDRLRSLPVPSFPLEGGDVVALGVPPGPRVGEVLRAVRTWWLDGGCVANDDVCREAARRLIEA
jgi:poly(A) polymerase/tRNA nucleotidyltransferase (CCA-adding enzyme)